MASPRSRRPLRNALLLPLTAAVALLLVPTASSFAQPSAPTAQEQVASLQLKMERATEDFDTAGETLRASEKRAAALRQLGVHKGVELDVARQQVARWAASVYRGGQITQLNSLLLSGSPQTFLDQMSTLQQLSKQQRAQLDRLKSARQALNTQQRDLDAELATQRKTAAVLKSRKAAIERDLAKWKALLLAAGPGTPEGAWSGSLPPYTGPVSQRGATALAFARSQMGKPYSWGAAGPSSYDCSGLTMRAWQAAGVSLPHSSRMQYSSSPHVPRSQLQPGDLVFFGSPITHVGIFVAGDTIIGAPTTGDVVRYQSISGMGKPYAGATRP